MGYEAEDGTKIVMSGVALHELTDRPACHMRDSYLLAWSGVAGADTPDPVVAARSVAELWTGFYKAENGARPRATYSSPRPVTVDGQGGSHVVADVAVPAGSCAAPRAAVHAVAVPDGKGQSIVWVLLTERDVPGALSDEQIDQVIGTLRPAGLQQKCDPTRRVVGSWC
jgi:hypothetical protein